jgi:hypothetical protein
MNEYLALITLENGHSLKYQDESNDLVQFIQFVYHTFPGCEIEMIVSIK